MRPLSRRDLFRLGGSAAAGTALTLADLKLAHLAPIPQIPNPLATYPERAWEEVYRNQHRFDSSFSFVCAPNDTHNCRLNAFVRNGVITRIEQPYDVQDYADLYGNHASISWNPRGCLKGLAYMRRVYSPFRIKYPLVRKGWKAWADAGFPRQADGMPPKEYFRRGEDDWVRVSWDELYTLTAKGFINIAQAYNGAQGERYLRAQGYEPEMIEAMRDADGDLAGVRTLKFRGGMAFLGATRLTAAYRFANMLAVLDDHLRGKGPDKSLGARAWDNYAWHTDLPPGHPMVHGVQTFDQEFNDFWNSDLFIMSGLNLVSSKMADPIWWQSLIERGGKIVVIAPEYSASAPKADYWVTVRPGTDAALMLGVARVLMEENLFNRPFVLRHTDFPLLIREDTLKLLRYEDLPDGAPLIDPGDTYVGPDGKPLQEMADELKTRAAVMTKDGALGLSRTALGDYLAKGFAALGRSLDSVELDWRGTVQTRKGPVAVRTLFAYYRELLAEYTLDNVEKITTTPKALVERLARDIAAAKATCFAGGMGFNMYFANDLINRAYYVVATLSGNVGKPGGNVGSYAGNYKSPVFNGLPAWILEDPFKQTLDPTVDGMAIKTRGYLKFESLHFWDSDDRPLIVDSPALGRVVLTGKTHMPNPSKTAWSVNVNLLGVAKWHYNLIKNTLPKMELYIAQDYEWNMNCEYADVVFPVDSWVEFKHHDMTGSCTNPFIQVFPKQRVPRLHDTRHDIEVFAGVARALTQLTGKQAFADHFKYIDEIGPEVYLQRIVDASVTMRGYNFRTMAKADKGFLTLFRTYPRIPGWEQIQESKPFYTRTGRLELYREEDEFIAQGANFVVHREPIEATPYQPRVILARRSFPGLRPVDYGIPATDDRPDQKTIYNAVMTAEQILASTNPLQVRQGLTFTFITPKPRHRTHSSWSTSDWNVIWASNFGDPYRHDQRSPWVGEEEMDINPADAKAHGIADGDYVWVDADPRDRPYVGRKEGDAFYEVARMMVRVKFNPSLPRGMLSMPHGVHGATHKSILAQKRNRDGSSLTESGYVAGARFGSQQSAVRAWLQPTQMTDSLARKDFYTHRIGKGFQVDTHTPTGAPKETRVRISKAENGGLGGQGAWEPGARGFSPGGENDAMRAYLAGDFLGAGGA